MINYTQEEIKDFMDAMEEIKKEKKAIKAIQTNNQFELINALEVIQIECFSHKECNDCPMFGGDLCMLKEDSPDKWDINYDCWRAFK